MKHFKICLLSFLLAIVFIGCGRDDVMEDIKADEPIVDNNFPPNSGGGVEFRSYEEEDCGSIKALCMRCIIESDKPVLALKELGGGGNGENQEGIDNNFLKVMVGEDEYTIRPAKFFGEESKEYLITTPTGNYITSDISNDYVNSKTLDTSLPKAFEGTFNLNHGTFADGNLGINEVKSAFGQESETLSHETGGYTIQIEDTGELSSTSALKLYNPCQGVTMAALVLRYQEILGMEGPHSNAEQIIENALYSCMPGGFDPRLDCINTQCVMDGILNDPEIGGSPYAQFLIKLNYLSTLMDLDEGTYDELKLYTSENITLVGEVYDNLFLDSSNPACSTNDCGKVGSNAAYIIMTLEGYSLSSSDKQTLEQIYGYIYCYDRSTFNCFISVNDFSAIERILEISNSPLGAGCSIEEIALSYAELYCESFYPDHPYFDAENLMYYDCVLSGELESINEDVGWGVWIKLAKFAKKVFKAYKKGDDLTKGSTWKDIAFDVFDAALALADGNVTIDEVIGAILDIGLGIDANDLKWMKRLLGFANDAAKLSPAQVDFALDIVDGDIQHRFRHFEKLGWIPSTGPVSGKIDAFKDLASQIMNTNPMKTVKDGDTIKYLHEYNGETIMVEIYDIGSITGPGVGKLKQIVKPKDGQIAKIMSLEDYVP